MTKEKIANILLRTSISFAFIYVAIATIIDQASWVSYAPSFIRNVFPESLLIGALAIGHSLLGVWILSGWRIFWPTLLAGLYLISLVGFNLSQIDILFRDISLALVAFALALQSKLEQKSTSKS